MGVRVRSFPTWLLRALLIVGVLVFSLLPVSALRAGEVHDLSNMNELPFCRHFAGKEGSFSPSKADYENVSRKLKSKTNIAGFRGETAQASMRAAELAFFSMQNFDCQEAFIALEAAFAYLNFHCEGQTGQTPCRHMPSDALANDAAMIVLVIKSIICSPGDS